MDVWVRVSSCMDVDSDLDSLTATHLQVTAGLNLTVYASKKEAQKAQQQRGGIILEVNAACLADVEHEFGKDVTLTSDADDKGSTSTSVYISVCYDGLPYKLVPNYGPNEPGTVEPQGEVAEFGPQAEAWLNKLEQETGFELSQ